MSGEEFVYDRQVGGDRLPGERINQHIIGTQDRERRLMMKLVGRTLVSLTLVLSSALWAQSEPGSNPGSKPGSDEESSVTARASAIIQARFNQSRPGIVVESIVPSKIDGLYKVQLQGGPSLYVTGDGGYFVMGDLFEVVQGGFVNLAEKEREGDRARLMGEVKSADMIVFAPQQLPAKAVINVFTDVDCYYCQKLHQEVPDLNRLGIEVRYLAYPRAGIGSDSYKKIASAWCADDKQAAITKLKNRQHIVSNVCPNNPVKAQFELGKKVGVTGTPAMVTTEGRLMPGYMPALQLANALNVVVDPEIGRELAMKAAAAQNKR